MKGAGPAARPPGSDAAVPPSLRSEVLLVAVLLAAAAALRGVRWERTIVMFNDGPHFLAMARRMGAGDWAGALGHDYHPLYPFLTLLGHLLGLRWEPAAAAVSVLCGALAVAMLYGLVRDTFGWPAAPIAAFLLAIHPRAVDFSADIQSEGAYMAAFLGALWLAWRSLSRRSWPLAAWAGAVSGLAYLVRPEGLGALLATGLVLGVYCLRGEWRLRDALAWLGAASLGALLVAGPYATALRVQNGAWSLTQKKSVAVLAGMTAETPVREAPAGNEAGMRLPAARPRSEQRLTVVPPRPRSAGRAALDLLDRSTSAARGEILLLLAVGLWSVRGRPGARGVFFLALVGLYGVVLADLSFNIGYVSRRHALPVILPLFGYAALGVPRLGSAVLRALRRPVTARWAIGVGLAVPLVAAGIALAPPRRAGDLALREAAQWLHTQHPQAVAAPRGRVAYYAGAPHVPVEPQLALLHPDALHAAGASHLILSLDDLSPAQWRELRARPGLRLLRRFDVNGEEALVFQVMAGDPAGGGGGG